MGKIECSCCKEDVTIQDINIMMAREESMEVAEYVKSFDGCYSKTLNETVCDECYIKAGTPSTNIKDIKDVEENRIKIINECKRRLGVK